MKNISFGRLVYKLTRVNIGEVRLENNLYTVDTYETHSGYFLSEVAVNEFITEQNLEGIGFYIVEVYVYNPTNLYQCQSSLYEYTLDVKGHIICMNDTLSFSPNMNDVLAEEITKFHGRDDIKIKKGDRAWFYNGKDQIVPCEIGEIPFTKKEAKKYGSLDFYDDSFLVYPLPKPEYDNHDHILSCYVFSEDTFNKIIHKR